MIIIILIVVVAVAAIVIALVVVVVIVLCNSTFDTLTVPPTSITVSRRYIYIYIYIYIYVCSLFPFRLFCAVLLFFKEKPFSNKNGISYGCGILTGKCSYDVFWLSRGRSLWGIPRCSYSRLLTYDCK